MRRSTILVLAAAALVLAACEIRTNYAMVVDDDTSATLAFEIAYDAEAAELFGSAESFLEDEIEGDVGSGIEGVTLLSAEADSSDPENQRVTATLSARDAEAFDRLVAELFPGSSFTNEAGSTWVLTLRPDADVAEDFGDDFALDELGLDFLSGEVRVDHAGSQLSMTGGTSEGGNEVLWDPYGVDSLEVVMDLSGATPPGGSEAEGEATPQERAEEPADDPAEEPADDPGDEPAEELLDEQGTEGEDAGVAAATQEDDGGLSPLLLVVIVGGLLLALALVLALVLRGRNTGAGTAARTAGEPTATATPSGRYQPPAPPPSPPRPTEGNRPQPPPPPPPPQGR